MNDFLKTIGVMLFGVALMAVFAGIAGFLVMLLWNALMPTLFGLPALTYFQSYGLYMLCWLLFGKPASTSKE